MKNKIKIIALFLVLSFNVALIIPANSNKVFAKKTTLKQLKKMEKENEKWHEKYPINHYIFLYKCKGNVICLEESISHSLTSLTYYKLKSDGQTLKTICTIDIKYENGQSIKMKKAGSSKYVKISKKKYKQIKKKYKIIKEI